MNIVAVIPARGGSKRIVGKNTRELGGKPLIAWTIEAALSVLPSENLIVSTDDAEIAAVAMTFGVNVPTLRPKLLAQDDTPTLAVLQHILKVLDISGAAVDGILLLQPTTPFRASAEISTAMKLFEDYSGERAIVSFSLSASSPYWAFTIDKGELNPVLGWDPLSKRSQDLATTYTPNGSIYVIPSERIRNQLPILSDDTIPLILTDPNSAIDIDDESDWKLAETAVAHLR